MGRLPPFRRTIVGVIAIYALLLQAFLSAATPAMTPAFMGVICASHDGSSPSSPDQPVRHDHQCCTAVHVENVASPPTPKPLVVGSPPRSIEVVFRHEASIPKTGPPTHAHSPRGPPLA